MTDPQVFHLMPVQPGLSLKGMVENYLECFDFMAFLVNYTRSNLIFSV